MRRVYSGGFGGGPVDWILNPGLKQHQAPRNAEY
jgi:hypothetical protein